MKKPISQNKLERGQILPMVVIGLVVMISMVGLIIDGGAILLNRRNAQNAADAGAMAGARILCNQTVFNESAVQAAVTQYVTTENHASVYDWEITTANLNNTPGLKRGEVVVTAEITQQSFFTGIFGQDAYIAKATAAAGCFPYKPQVVLPIAWSCRAPAAGSVSEDCDYVRLDWQEVKTIAAPYLTLPLPAGKKPTAAQAEGISDAMFAAHSTSIYIIVDSEKVCGEDIICDFNTSDTIDRYQLSSGGQRGWLNLDGSSGGASTIREWIISGLKTNLKSHTWLSGKGGNMNSVYSAFLERRDQIVWVPIFNVMCDGLPSNEPQCLNAAHSATAPGLPLEPGDTEVIITGSPATPMYHVVSIVPFMITCVHSQPGDVCPGFSLAQSINPGLKNNTNAVEGYFVSQDSLGEDVDPYGADMGVYTVSLTR